MTKSVACSCISIVYKRFFIFWRGKCGTKGREFSERKRRKVGKFRGPAVEEEKLLSRDLIYLRRELARRLSN